ncbi:MAG TPA: methyltransferase domain-containing protein [Thiotrichaceae bacterium]|nr:methyltransferase domain-containing protein [Thiotrichaceae bacterium]
MADKIYDLTLSFWNSAVIRAGLKLNLFNLLEKQALSPTEVSQDIKASNPRFIQAFLDACAILGLLEKQGDKFTNSAISNEFLVPHQPKYLGDYVCHVTNYWHTWGKLDTLLLEGRTELPFENGFTDVPTYWTDYMKAQHNRAMMGQGAKLVENVDLNGKQRLLDLGGGMGSYSIALCAANPQLKAVVIDQKESLDMARKIVDEHDLADRITLVEGDFNTIELDSNYDAILISGVIVLHSEEENHQIFRRAYNALLPGGLIIVQDFMRIDHNPTRKLFDTMMDLYLLVGYTPKGGDRDGDEIASWLKDTEFVNVKQIPLPTQLALIIAEKPVE